jgi:hypothetical protein
MLRAMSYLRHVLIKTYYAMVEIATVRPRIGSSKDDVTCPAATETYYALISRQGSHYSLATQQFYG